MADILDDLLLGLDSHGLVISSIHEVLPHWAHGGPAV